MTYNEVISGFEVYENPPKRKGYDRHHIVPQCEQKKLYGSVTDNRQIYCSLPQHMWLHILYDREHGTKTAKRFLDICGKPMEFFTCYELCLAYSYTLRKKKEEQLKKLAEVKKTPEYRQKLSDALNRPEVRQKRSDSMKGKTFSEERKQHISDSRKGFIFTEEHRQKLADAKKGNTINKGRKWFNNGIKNVMTYECPDGFVPGILKRKVV